MMNKFCCKDFAKQTVDMSFVGGGWLYPFEMKPEYQIELDEVSGLWNVNGCCGGGCYVLQDLVFCPFCGKNIKQPTPTPLSKQDDN